MLTAIGVYVVELVLDLSNLLREDFTPGVVAIGLLLWLALASGWIGIKTQQRVQALEWFRRNIEKLADDPGQLSNAIQELSQKIQSARNKTKARQAVATAWSEYHETIIEHEEDGRTILRNSVRPSQFFNLDDLHFGPGFSRIFPSLFVTVGLFLTFLGLIAALHQMNADDGVSAQAMSNLLAIASAKFIMSLTGLLCSILFTIVLRWRMGKVEGAIHGLNEVLEKRLSFLSLEALTLEQLKAVREQREHFRTIGMELVAELGRPLREEVPRTISDSIGQAVAPLISQIGKLGTESIGEMAGELSERMAKDVEGALGRASDQLNLAGERLGGLVDRMDSTSGRMGSGMEGAGERLTRAVESMEQAAEGIRMALHSAAEDGAQAARNRMEEAGGAVSVAIGETGDRIRTAIEGTGQEIASVAKQITASANEELLNPLSNMAEQFEALVAALSDGASQIRQASQGIRSGTEASNEAASGLRSSAQTLVSASEQMKPGIQQMLDATRALAASTQAVGESTKRNTESAAQTLAAAQTALGGQEKAIESTLAGLSNSLREFRGQGERLDDMDRKLGKAFELYRTEVQQAVDNLREHVRDMRDKLTPALDTLREIVEQAESFQPESRRR